MAFENTRLRDFAIRGEFVLKKVLAFITEFQLIHFSKKIMGQAIK